MKKTFSLVALVSTLTPLLSIAEVKLDTQHITAEKISEAELSNSMRITRDEIELLQASNLSEVLISLPGFQVTQQGGNANTQSFVMNGFRSNQVLILLNGQRFGSATLGQTTYNTIPSSIIQRIEIVSNARSAIYGSDALGGVINIVTTKETEQNNSLRVALGNQNTSQLSTDLHKVIGGLSLHASAFTEKTQGFDVLSENDDDTDGSERHTLGFDTVYKINKQQRLMAKFQSNRGSVDYDGTSGSNRKRDYQQQVSGIGWSYSDDLYGITTNYNESSDKSWNYGNGTSRSDSDGFITESKNLDLTARAKVSDSHTLLLVTDFREDDVSKSDSIYDKTKGDINGIGLSHTFESAVLNSEIGVRRDDSSLFEESYSYSASAQLFALDNFSITTAINTGFKAPSFNDLYFPFADYGSLGTYAGNDSLTPEKSLNRRLSLQYNIGKSKYLASYQFSHIDDLIQWQNNDGENTPVNVDQVLLRNTTFSWQQDWLDTFTSQLSYDWNHAIDMKSHRLLQRQSARVVKLNLNYISGEFSSGTNIRYLSESYDDAENEDLLAAYTIADAYGDLEISENFTLGLRVNNIGNKQYQTAKGYPAQERTYLFNGTLTF